MKQQAKEQEHYDNGKKALIDNNHALAIDEFTKAIAIDSTNADTFNNRGVAHERKGELTKAITDYTSAIELFPSNEDKTMLADFYIYRGSIHHIKMNYNQAITDFTEAIKFNPSFTDAYWNRGNAHLNKGDNAKAIEDYNQAIKIDSNYTAKITPSLAEAYRRQGLSSLEIGNYDDALMDFSKAIDLQPNDSEAYLRRGAAYMKKQDFPNAIKDFDKAIELTPKNTAAYYNRGRIYDMSNTTEGLKKAIDDYSKTIEIDPYFVAAYSNRGLLYAESNELDKGIEDYNTVIEFGQEDADAYNSRGHIYRLKKEYDHAIKDLKQAIKLDPDYAYAYNNLGSTYNDLGNINNNENDFDEAISNFNKAIELDTKYAIAYYNRGLSYNFKCVIYINKMKACYKTNTPYSVYDDEAITNYDNAIADYTKSIQLKPDYVKAHNARSELYLIKGEKEKAQSDFEKANSLPPNRVDSSTTADTYNIQSDFAIAIRGLPDASELSNQLLYKYKTIDLNTLSALNNDSIWVPSPKTFNDPLDGSYLYDKIKDPCFQKQLDGIGIISFESKTTEKGGINTLMWSHYADSHKGICLIYKRTDCQDNEQIDPKNNRILKMNYEDDISLRIDTTENMIETGFCTKHSNWDYENEYRLLLHQENLGAGCLFSAEKLNLTLIGIIFGLKCTEEDVVKKVLKENDIKYYKIDQEVKHRITKHLQLIKTESKGSKGLVP